MKTETAWKFSKRLLFGQMYEDVNLELRAFPTRSRVFCIASAGCTAIALSAHHQVTAVDLNPAQVEYARQRAAGAPRKWGLLDRIMRVQRKTLVLAGWTATRLERFLSFENCADQLAYWQTHLNTLRFRTAFDCKLAGDGLAVRLFTGDRNFPGLRLGIIVRRRLECGFARHANRTNPYVQRLFGNEFAPAETPPMHPIRFETANAVDFLNAMPANSFDAFSLSNIADVAAPAFRIRLIEAVQHAASPGAIVVLRSFGEPRNSTEAEWAVQDRAMLWGSIQIVPARELR
jgi:S-adenosylmethionine:diacylglycerol 3-amino-3-carboxypropyl transferase